MAKELGTFDTTGQTLTARIINRATDAVTNINLSEGPTGAYYGNMPTLDEGTYDVQYLRGSLPIGGETLEWDGAAVITLAGIKAKTDLIDASGIEVVVSSPIVNGEDLELVPGDDYKLADNRQISFLINNISTHVTGTQLVVYETNDDEILTIDGGYVDEAELNQRVYAKFDIEGDDTDELSGEYKYAVHLTLESGSVITPISGRLIMKI